MKKLLLLSLSFLISTNVSAATFMMENDLPTHPDIMPVRVIDVVYQICIGTNPCTEETASVRTDATFSKLIPVLLGQVATVRGLRGTFFKFHDDGRPIGVVTIKFGSACYTKFEEHQQGALILGNSGDGQLSCIPAGL